MNKKIIAAAQKEAQALVNAFEIEVQEIERLALEAAHGNEKPTGTQFEAYQKMFDFFNDELFNNKLPQCLLNLSRMNKAYGFFAPERWVGTNPEDVKHEISLNPDHLAREPKATVGTLVHEMCHLQRQVTGKKPTGGYHDKDWAQMMKNVGLYPSSTAAEGGKETGPKVSHYILEGDRFDLAFEAMPKEYLLPFVHVPAPEKEKKAKAASKTKFTCPQCEANAWGKPDTNLICGDCYEETEEAVKMIEA